MKFMQHAAPITQKVENVSMQSRSRASSSSGTQQICMLDESSDEELPTL